MCMNCQDPKWRTSSWTHISTEHNQVMVSIVILLFFVCIAWSNKSDRETKIIYYDVTTSKAFRTKKSGHSSGLQDTEPFLWAHIIDQPTEIPEEESQLSPFYTRWWWWPAQIAKICLEKLVSKKAPDRHQAGRMQHGDQLWTRGGQ